MRNVEWWWHCQLFLHVILFSIQLCQTALNCIRINDTFKWNRRSGIHIHIHIQFSFVARTEGSKRNFRSLIKKCKWNYDLVWLWLFVWSLCHDFFFAFCFFFNFHQRFSLQFFTQHKLLNRFTGKRTYTMVLFKEKSNGSHCVPL